MSSRPSPSRCLFNTPATTGVREEEDLVYVANTLDGLDRVDQGEAPIEGDVLISITFPGFIMENLDLAPDADPAEVVDTFKALLDASGDPEEYMGVLDPATEVILTGDAIPGGGAYLLAIGFDAGTVLMAVQSVGDVRAHQDVIDLIASTMVYEGREGGFDMDSTTGSVTPTPTPNDAVVAVELRQWASAADGTSQYGTDSWSFAQATGAPDTNSCGDLSSAWASESGTGSDILALEYDTAVVPSEINIYQTFNPGSIIKVEVANRDTGATFELANSADPPGNTPCPGVFTVDASAIDTPVDGVIIYLDQSIGGNWNEIDAVELVGTTGGDGVVQLENEPEYAGDTVFFAVVPNGEFSYRVPSGWAFGSDDGQWYLANSDEGLVRVQNGEDAVGDDILIAVASPLLLADLGIDANIDPVEGIRTFAQLQGIDGEPETYKGLQAPAAVARLTGEGVPNGEAWVYAIQFEDGTVFAALQIGLNVLSPDVINPSIDAILRSFTYTGP